MKKIILLGILIILMVITNPSKIEYVDWAKEQIKEQSTYEVVDWGIELLAPNLLEGATKAHNYVIFSVFKTTIMDDTITTVGLFKNFLPLPIDDNGSYHTNSAPVKESVQSEQVSVEKTATDDTPATSESQNTDYRSVPFIRDNNNKPINKTVIWKGKLESKSLDIKLNDGKAELVIGLDNPNGIKIMMLHKDTGWYLDWMKYGESPVYEFGTTESESYAVQGTTYDFDKDGSDEIIISIGDGLVNGQMWIFKYHEITRNDVTPYELLLTQSFQENVYIDENKVIIPYGSQGLFNEYTFFDGKFHEQVH
ncbi:hypothetical protein SAMN05877753_1058 [Bacillus oleivorans]|uniref:Uncharacterized protein n=1 Tax=Bacillus oleivorans TaxID=1448271 RepID=A0A285CUG9_9BACI|nr:DUF4359 domain-containing protein [Bacillus oleivorans]SNX71164.1 hypothetical protein SAMN05877753_1058 [Bacillus oleivorans]